MSTILSVLLKAFLSQFVEIFKDFINDWQENRMHKQAGRSEVIAEGQEKLNEVANEQMEAAVNRPSDDALLDQLRSGKGI